MHFKMFMQIRPLVNLPILFNCEIFPMTERAMERHCDKKGHFAMSCIMLIFNIIMDVNKVITWYYSIK